MTSKIESLGQEILRYFGEFSDTLHAPLFDSQHVAAVAKCVENGEVSTYGAVVGEFESELKRFYGSNVIATNSGTSALHLLLLSHGIGPGDIVFCTSISFAATANAILYCGATPFFVDVDCDLLLSLDSLQSALNSDFSSLSGRCVHTKSGQIAKGVLLLHPLGSTMDTLELLNVAAANNLYVFEDAAQALGSRDHAGNLAGTTGAGGAISFNGNKIITSGAGGAIVLSDPEKYGLALSLATVGRVGPKHLVIHERLGYNYRMASLNASLGLASFARFNEVLKRKRAVRAFYVEICKHLDLELLHQDLEGTPNFWLNAIRVRPDELEEYIQVLGHMSIGARRLWEPLHLLPHLSKFQRTDLSNAELASSSIICLPSSPVEA